jgi:hypothetical protein
MLRHVRWKLPRLMLCAGGNATWNPLGGDATQYDPNVRLSG